MSNDSRGVSQIPIGTPVIAFDGEELGKVREVYPNYILVGEEGEPEDLQISVHAIVGVENGSLRVSVTRRAISQVDDLGS